MKHIISAFLVLVLWSGAAVGQVIDWAYRTGSSGWDETYEVEVDDAGNVYATGVYSGTVDFDPSSTNTVNLTSVAGTWDVFVTKTDTDGNLLWAKSLGSDNTDNVLGLEIDGNGNVFVTGWYAGTFDADPSGSVVNLTYVGGSDMFIVKLNSSGGYVWSGQISGTGDDGAFGLSVGPDGSVYASGYFQNSVALDPTGGTDNYTTNGGDDAFLIKMDNNGVYQWGRRIGGTGDDLLRPVEVRPDGMVVAAGIFESNVNLDAVGGSYPATADADRDIFVVKYGADGSFHSAGTMTATGSAAVYGIESDFDNNVVLAGVYSTDIDLDHTAASDMRGNVDASGIFVTKIDLNWNYLWGRTYSGPGFDFLNKASIDPLGNVVVAGTFSQTMDIDPTGGTEPVTATGSTDIFISLLDPDGNFIWGTRMGGTADITLNSSASSTTADLILGGYFSGTFDADPWLGYEPLSTAGDNDAFLIKLAHCNLPYIDGNVTMGGSPCANCMVYAYAYPGATGIMWPKVDSTYTDVNGNYFMSLPPDAELMFQAMPPNTTAAAVPTYSGDVHLWSTAQHFNTTCGSSHTSDIALMTYTPMSGTCTLSGTINQQSWKMMEEDPIPLIDVVIERIPPGNVTDRVVTGPNGEFEFDLVEADANPYLVRVMIPGLPVVNAFMVQVNAGDVAVSDLYYCIDDDTSYISPCTDFSAVQVHSASTTFTLAPNPNNGISVLKGSITGATEVQVTDVMGRQVFTERLVGHGLVSWPLHLGHLRPGIYSVSVNGQSLRMVKE